METYYLNTLILFFKSQQEMDFECIKYILDIIDDDTLDDEDKRDIIIGNLQDAGLNETTYKDGKFDPTEYPSLETEEIELEECEMQQHDQIKHKVYFKTEFVELNLLNGMLTHGIPLN